MTTIISIIAIIAIIVIVITIITVLAVIITKSGLQILSRELQVLPNSKTTAN